MLKSWIAAGVKIMTAVQDATQAMYIPPGWICVERCVRGVLVYGARHSFFVRTQAAKASFDQFMGLSGANTEQREKLNIISELMDPE